VVLLHDWLTGIRGAEKVLDVFCREWPDAVLYTLLHKKNSATPAIEALKPRTSFLGYLPFVYRYYRGLLPLMPFAIEWLKLPKCDLVLSSSYCVVKSVHVPAGTMHICYCHTPMRYAWYMEGYFGKWREGDGWRAKLKGWYGMKYRLASMVMAQLRAWDNRTANRVTHFIANSKTVQKRILDCYGRSSEVIYPPVDTDYYCPAPVQREDFYLIVSAFVPYKRLDVALEACKILGRNLIVIGDGHDHTRLRQLKGPTIQFLSRQPDEVVRDHFRRCKALLFPGEEDFGIVPVEAQACGAPVIAFGKGGATETIIPLHHNDGNPTGVWFEQQTAESMMAAIQLFEKHEKGFNPQFIRTHATKFNRKRFETEILDYIAGKKDGIVQRTQYTQKLSNLQQ
jgi:glycosyltransferase involved in cell wall biosynthesis